MFESPNYHSLLEQIESKLTDAFDYIAVSCRKYIDIVSSYDVMHQTVLDIERRRLCLREMVRTVFCFEYMMYMVIFIMFVEMYDSAVWRHTEISFENKKI